MNTNEVFDYLFKTFPKAQESKSMTKRPRKDLTWTKKAANIFAATGPRGGGLWLTYNVKSNKIVLTRYKEPSSVS